MKKEERFMENIGSVLDGLTWNTGYMKCSELMLWNLHLSGASREWGAKGRASEGKVIWRRSESREPYSLAVLTACWTSPHGHLPMDISVATQHHSYLLFQTCCSSSSPCCSYGTLPTRCPTKSLKAKADILWEACVPDYWGTRGGMGWRGPAMPLCKTSESRHWFPIQAHAQSLQFVGVDWNTNCFEKKCKWCL